MRFRLPLLSAALALCFLSPAAAQTRIRIVASNITSGNNQSYQAPGTNILKALKPDIALMNEFTVDSGTLAQWVSSTFGPGYSFYVEGGAQIPNGIVSKYPILASGEYPDPFVSNRDFAWARIDIPGNRDLWAISTHLLTTSTTNRNNQAGVVINDLIPSLNIPANDYIVFGGDFNTDNRSESCLSTLRARFTIQSPYPVDQNNNGNTNAGRNKPYDWVVVSPNLHALETPFTYGSRSFAAGFVFDSRVFSQSDLNTYFPPVQVSDSAATNMQHQAVIRDFLVDGTTTPVNYVVNGSSVNFGTGLDAAAGPFTNSTVTLTVNTPFNVTGVSFIGSHPAEFAVSTPNLSALPATISANTPIGFRWTPAGNDGDPRNVTATFTTTGNPSGFAVTLAGSVRTEGGGGSGGEGAVYFTEDFNSTNLTGSYTTGVFTAASGSWDGLSVILEATAASRTGNAVRINDDTAGAMIRTPLLSQGAGTLKFWVRELNSGGGTLSVRAASAPTGPFDVIATNAFAGTTFTELTIPVRRTGSLYLQILNDNQAGHLIIDDLSLTSFTEAPPTPTPPQGWMMR